MLAKANVAPVTPSVAVAAPGVSLSDVMLLKVVEFVAFVNVPPFELEIVRALKPVFEVMVNVLFRPDAPVKVMFAALELSVEKLVRVVALNAMNPTSVSPV